MPGKDSLEGREQYRKEQIARWKSDEIKRIIAERDALKERVKVVEGALDIICNVVIEHSDDCGILRDQEGCTNPGDINCGQCWKEYAIKQAEASE